MAPEIEERVPIDALPKGEIAMLSESEHECFNAERLQKHWHLGERDIPKRTSPFLVPWRDLAEKWRSLDESALAAISEVLGVVRWRVYRVGQGGEGI